MSTGSSIWIGWADTDPNGRYVRDVPSHHRSPVTKAQSTATERNVDSISRWAIDTGGWTLNSFTPQEYLKQAIPQELCNADPRAAGRFVRGNEAKRDTILPMRMEISIQDGLHGPKIPDTRTGIERRKAYVTHQDVALWQITLTLHIRAPESWWKQAQHYFPEIVWIRGRPDSEDSSRRLKQNDFEDEVADSVLAHLNSLIESNNREALLIQLPNSFLRTGLVHTNMDVILRIDRERSHYNAGHWYEFCRRIRTLREIERVFAFPDSVA